MYIELEAWGSPITHFINLKPTQNKSLKVLNISVSLQRKYTLNISDLYD